MSDKSWTPYFRRNVDIIDENKGIEGEPHCKSQGAGYPGAPCLSEDVKVQ